MRVYHFTSERHALEALAKQRLKVATFGDLNDPFELLSSDFTDPRVRQPFREWKRRMSQVMGLLCFSRHWNNPLLWSHYADKHKGIALQFEVSDDVAVPVTYRKSRMRLDMTKVLKKEQFSAEYAEKLAATKSSHWAYEEEVRVPVDLAECDRESDLWFERFSHDVRLVGVICGPLSRIKNSDIASSLPKGLIIDGRRARLAFQTFSVVSNKGKAQSKIYSKL